MADRINLRDVLSAGRGRLSGWDRDHQDRRGKDEKYARQCRDDQLPSVAAQTEQLILSPQHCENNHPNGVSPACLRPRARGFALLRQPGGFEGIGPAGVLVRVDDLAVAQLEMGPAEEIKLYPAPPTPAGDAHPGNDVVTVLS